MEKSRHFILSKLFAYFPVTPKSNANSRVISSEDITLDDYLSRERSLGSITLRPLLFSQDRDRRTVVHSEFGKGDIVISSYPSSLYHLEIRDSVDEFALADAINASMALMEIGSQQADDDIGLVQIHPENIPNSRTIIGLEELSSLFVNIETTNPLAFNSRVGYGWQIDFSLWEFAS